MPVSTDTADWSEQDNMPLNLSYLLCWFDLVNIEATLFIFIINYLILSA